ncbi:hypothetical protein DEH69_26530 [Streptomyces sp. PT12]|nr:hypothetical protein DEH69_26530 [Streptomyces sp. PT12]
MHRVLDLVHEREPAVPRLPRCFVAAYEKLAEALETEADLTPQGRSVTLDRLVLALTNQIKVRALVEPGHVSAEPEGFRPVVITGLPGTGIRFLQGMLSQHPEFSVPSLWEVLSPTADGAPWAEAREPADPFEGALWRALWPFSGVRGPDLGRPYGDHLLLGYCFSSFSVGLEYRIPGYLAWLMKQDARLAYTFHRYALAAILDRVSGGIPLLVNEFHSFRLSDLLHAYPDARIVRVHRDPLVSLSRLADTSSRLRRAWSSTAGSREAAGEWAACMASALSSGEWYGPVPWPGVDVLDMDYSEIVQTPLLAVRRICEFARTPVPSGVERRMFRGWKPTVAPDERLPDGEGPGFDVARLPVSFLRERENYGSWRSAHARQ